MKPNRTDYFFLLTIMFFSLGFFNIIFAWLGWACLILPFIFLVKDKKKTWCNKYCGRSSLFRALFQGRSLTGGFGPDWLVKGRGKWIMLTYFCFNFFVLTMSTIRVSLGKMEPVEQVRFLIAFPLPWSMPQILTIGLFPDWAVHLSFRIYSMMFTTTILGLILAWLFMPRTWCRICPVNTLSDIGLKRMEKEASSSDGKAETI